MLKNASSRNLDLHSTPKGLNNDEMAFVYRKTNQNGHLPTEHNNPPKMLQSAPI